MNKSQRTILLKELLQLIKVIDPYSVAEVNYSAIMPTKRRFRADYYIPKLSVLIEVNGGQYVTGRHNRGGTGYETDLTKLNLASANGFTVLQYTYEMLAKGDHIQDLKNLQTTHKHKAV